MVALPVMAIMFITALSIWGLFFNFSAGDITLRPTPIRGYDKSLYVTFQAMFYVSIANMVLGVLILLRGSR